MAFSCEYCGSVLHAGDSVCPSCGAPVPPFAEDLRPQKPGVPETIEELLDFCRSKNMPLEKMRFFIGRDVSSPRAFGIFRDGGEFVVYKNKSDGTRAERYRGPDEARAVREIYLKLRDEVALRRGSGGGQPEQRPSRRRGGLTGCLRQPIVLAIIAVIGLSAIVGSCGRKPPKGYYNYENNYYYYQSGDWYRYDYSDAYWYAAGAVDAELERHAGQYYATDSYQEDFGVSDFRDSQYSGSAVSASSDDRDRDDEDDWDPDDDNWDYDYDSWDSGDTDWDSDW